MINSYNFGRIVVDGTLYTADLIILPSGILDSWWREKGHELCLKDIKAVAEVHPDCLVVGTGAEAMMMVLPEVKRYYSEMGIELIVEDTPRACKTFNSMSTKKKMAAALHLTC
ncbi:MAG: Mth938-like domain-containing protein [Deltaproteobacteria bacterium]|nr:Mth938-like domain-containing protein [Deltaproteobacteria bacterium]